MNQYDDRYDDEYVAMTDDEIRDFKHLPAEMLCLLGYYAPFLPDDAETPPDDAEMPLPDDLEFQAWHSGVGYARVVVFRLVANQVMEILRTGIVSMPLPWVNLNAIPISRLGPSSAIFFYASTSGLTFGPFFLV